MFTYDARYRPLEDQLRGPGRTIADYAHDPLTFPAPCRPKTRRQRAARSSLILIVNRSVTASPRSSDAVFSSSATIAKGGGDPPFVFWFHRWRAGALDRDRGEPHGPPPPTPPCMRVRTRRFGG